MKEKLRVLFKTGFFHLFTFQVLNKIIAMCSSLVVINILSRTDYGNYTYADNTLNMFLLLSGIGTVTGILQFGSEHYDDEQKKNAFLRFGYKVGILFNVGLCAVLFLSIYVYPYPLAGAVPYIAMLSILPLFMFTSEVIAIKLRVDLKNKEYSLYNTLTAGLLLISTYVGAKLQGPTAVIIGRYLAYFATFLVIFFFYKNFFGGKAQGEPLTGEEKKSFMKISLVSAVNNGISHMLILLDVFLIGQLIKDAEVVATYKTATTIPFAMVFIPQCVMIYIYPYFARHGQDKDWIRENYKKVFWLMFAGNALISAALWFAAPLIIALLFPKYPDSLPVFRFLSVGYFFTATFRIPSGNILLMLKKVNFNLLVAIVSGVLNIILDIAFIKLWGSMGAALATVSIYIISGAISTVYLNWYIRK